MAPTSMLATLSTSCSRYSSRGGSSRWRPSLPSSSSPWRKPASARDSSERNSPLPPAAAPPPAASRLSTRRPRTMSCIEACSAPSPPGCPGPGCPACEPPATSAKRSAKASSCHTAAGPLAAPSTASAGSSAVLACCCSTSSSAVRSPLAAPGPSGIRDSVGCPLAGGVAAPAPIPNKPAANEAAAW